MDEDFKRAIEDLHVVSSVRFHAGDKTHKAGVYANLRCSAASSHGGCGAKLVGPIRMSTKFPTLRDCLRELGRLIQQDHDPTCVAAAQELQAAEKDAADASTAEHRLRGKLRQPLSRPSVRQGVLVMSSLTASVVMFQRRSLREGMPSFRTKSFGPGSKEQTMQRISSRKRISTSGLRDLRITNG